MFQNIRHFSDISRVCRSDITFHGSYMALFIASSKTDSYKEGHWLVISRLTSPNCPVNMLERYFILAAQIPHTSIAYIFRSVAASRLSTHN